MKNILTIKAYDYKDEKELKQHEKKLEYQGYRMIKDEFYGKFKSPCINNNEELPLTAYYYKDNLQ